MDGPGRTKLRSQRLDLLLLVADAGDQQPGLGTRGHGLCKGLDQGGHVLHRVDPGGDAVDDVLLIPVKAQLSQVFLTGLVGKLFGEADAVVDDLHPAAVVAPALHALFHVVAHRHPAVTPPQGHPVQKTDGVIGSRAAHVVQTGVRMDGGNNGAAGLAHEHGHHIGLGAVAVENVVALVFQVFFQLPGDVEQAPLFQDPGIDAALPGLLGKGTLHEADQLHLVSLAQLLQQADDVGLGTAHVAAGDQMHDLHKITPA